jgi:hypothetical protein
MLKKIVFALTLVAFTTSATSAIACGKGQMLIRIDDGSIIGGTTCADFGGSFWGNVWSFYFR